MLDIRPHAMTLLKVSLLTAALAACTVGPDYVRPTMATPENFARDEVPAVTTSSDATTEVAPTDADVAGTTGGDASTAPSPEASAEFWRSFNDPLLTRLVDESLSANHDLRIALAHYDRANALLRGAKFDRLPDGDRQRHRQRLARQRRPGAWRRRATIATARATACRPTLSWELDLFGRVRRDVESQRAETWATAADLDALQVAIVGEVARSYVELRGLQERLRVAHGQRRQPARNAAPGAGALRRRSRYRVRHVACPRAARDHAVARAGAGSAGGGDHASARRADRTNARMR